AGTAGRVRGGFRPWRAAGLEAGRLDVGILGPASPLGWGRVAYRVLTGSRREDRHLGRYRARLVEIRADRDLPRQVDGEVIEQGRSLTVTVLPAALLVRVPGPRGPVRARFGGCAGTPARA